MSLENPHLVLGIAPQASSQEARRRYLELVRQFPPDRAAERFREIHAAYQAFTDPLIRAEALMGDEREAGKIRPWEEITEQAAETSPRLAVDVLLALGNPWHEPDADKPDADKPDADKPGER